MRYLVDITAYHPGTGQETVLRFCSGQEFVTRPADTPANVAYEPRVLQPGLFRQDMYSEGKTSGASSTGFGRTVLTNLDGALDAYLDYGFDGRSIVVRAGDADAEVYPDSFPAVLVGTMEQPVVDWQKFPLLIRDRQAELNVPLQPNKYAGDNVLPDGLEGVEDLKGKPKPRLFGRRKNVTPVLVNTSRLVYQLNDGELSDIPAVYDEGVALTAGEPYADQADMEANAPAAGEYRAWLAGGYFRLGSSPAGQITADGIEGATAADRTLAQISRRIVLERIVATDLVDKAFTDLDAAAPAEIGLYADAEITVSAALDALMPAAGAWYGFDNLGKFRLGRLELPSATKALAVLTAGDEFSIERLATGDAGSGLPVWRVAVGYDRNCTVQASGLAGAVDVERKNWLKDGLRYAEVKDESIKTVHPLATELVIETELATYEDALAEAQRQFALRSTRRDLLRVKTLLSGISYPDGGVWENESVADMPVSLSDARIAVHGRYAYMVGGYVWGVGLSAAVLRLDLDNPTGAWDSTTVTPMPFGRVPSGVVVSGDYLIVVGGRTGAGIFGPTASVIRLDLTNPGGAWDDAGISDLPQPWADAPVVLDGTALYLFGGTYGLTSSPRAMTVRLDLANPTGGWSDAAVSDLPVPRQLAAAAVYGRYAYLVGGRDGGGVATASVIRLNLDNPAGGWDDAGVSDMPVAVHYHCTFVSGTYLYVLGGPGDQPTPTMRLDLANPTGPWDDIGIADLPEPRAAACGVADQGRIFLIGGGRYGIDTPNTYLLLTNDSLQDRSRLWDLGRTLCLLVDRYGYTTGKAMCVIGSEVNHDSQRITLDLWG